jgi:exosortase A-associated hydrolase 2
VLAAAGAEVLQIDLRGCGDSSGEPGQVTWADWQADVARGADFLRRRHPSLPLWLWAQRAGALLAGSAVATDHLLLWQPLTSGHDLVRHWLRHQAAAALAQGRAGAPAMQAAQAEWQAGRTVDIAGYPITAALMRTCEPIAMVPPPGRPAGRIVWLDVHPQPRSDPPPAHVPVHQAWRAAGWQLTYACVEGPPYWQVPDTAEAPVLAARSVEALFGTTAA